MINKPELDKNDNVKSLNVKSLVLIKYFSSLLIEILNSIEDKNLYQGEKAHFYKPFIKWVNWYIECCWTELRNISKTLKKNNHPNFSERIVFHNNNQKHLVNLFNYLISMLCVGKGNYLGNIRISQVINISLENYHSIASILENNQQSYNLISPLITNEKKISINGLEESSISLSGYNQYKETLEKIFKEAHSWNSSIQINILAQLKASFEKTLCNFIEQATILLKEELSVDLFFIDPRVEILSLLLDELDLLPNMQSFFVPYITGTALEDEIVKSIFTEKQNNLKQIDYFITLYEINNANTPITIKNLQQFFHKVRTYNIRATLPPEVGFDFLTIFKLKDKELEQIIQDCVQREEALNSLGLKIYQWHVETSGEIPEFPVQTLSQLKLTGLKLFINKILNSLSNNKIVFTLNQRCHTYHVEKNDISPKKELTPLQLPKQGILKKSDSDTKIERKSRGIKWSEDKKRQSDFFVDYTPVTVKPRSRSILITKADTIKPQALSRENTRKKIPVVWENTNVEDRKSDQTEISFKPI